MPRSITWVLAAGLLLAVGACSDGLDGTDRTNKYVDKVAPEWPAGDALAALDVGRTHIALEWPPAQDEGGVAEYRIFVNYKPVKTVQGTTHLLSLLKPGTAYEVMVQAIDRTGHASTDGLSVKVTTRASTRAARTGRWGAKR